MNKLIVCLVVLVPGLALAQAGSWEGGVWAPEGGGADWVTIVLAILAAIVPIAGAVSAAFPSVGKIMKIVDVFAFNWGKARNDPGAQ